MGSCVGGGAVQFVTLLKHQPLANGLTIVPVLERGREWPFCAGCKLAK